MYPQSRRVARQVQQKEQAAAGTTRPHCLAVSFRLADGHEGCD